jgi:WXG100 family type VII secretion target
VTSEIQFNSTSVDDLADALSRAATGITESIARLESQLQAVAWTGSAELAYQDAQSQWTAVMTEMSSLLKLAEKAVAGAST